MHMTYRYTELMAGVVALGSSIAVFVLFMTISNDPVYPNKIYIAIKPGSASWAWGMFSISSMFYYYVRSHGTTTSGGYINPLLSRLLAIVQMLPLFGLTLSWIGGGELVSDSQGLGTMITASSALLDAMLVLFVAAHFGAGIISLKRFLKQSPVSTK